MQNQGMNRGMVDVTPDVRLLRVLRSSGVNLQTAMGEILDNSIDAGASEIDVYVFKNDREKSNIMVVDNGKGMNDVTLRGAFTLAKELKFGIDQIGKYGMGMKTAALSLSTQFEVITQKASGEVLFGEYNINKMEQQGEFKTTVRLADEVETTLFKSKLRRKQRSGTIVIIKNCDRLDTTHPTFVKQMQQFIGLAYKNFIKRGINFTVSDFPVKGDKVEAIDVLMRENDKTHIISERDTYPIEFETKIGQRKNTFIEVSSTVLPKPDKGSKGKKIDGKDVQLPLNQTHQGIYVYREGRMVGQGLSWVNVFGEKHNEKNRFRIEINCNSELDDAVNMNFLKGNVNPINTLKNQLAEIIEPYMEEMREVLRQEEEKEMTVQTSRDTSVDKKVTRKIEMVINKPISSQVEKEEKVSEKVIRNKNVKKAKSKKELLVAAKEIRAVLESKRTSEKTKKEFMEALGLTYSVPVTV